MVRIDEATIYTRREAEELLLNSGIGLDAFFEHFQTKPSFRRIILGTELLAIMRIAGEAVSQRAARRGDLKDAERVDVDRILSRQQESSPAKATNDTVLNRWKHLISDTVPKPLSRARMNRTDDKPVRNTRKAR